MKILLVNKFHYIKGGSETYYFGLGSLIAKYGHKVIYFSMKDEKNFPCAQEKYFVNNVDFNIPMKKVELAKSALKMLYSFEAKKKFEQLIKVEKPDIIHLNIFQSQLTGSIVDVAQKHKIPIVYTAHDLKSVCPNYQMLNHGEICEKCLHAAYWNCFKSGCMKDSRAKSLLATMEAYIYRFKHTYNKIDLVITPSYFYKKKIEASGNMLCPVVHMANFLPEGTRYSTSYKRGGYFLYFGRLSREKGILTLIRAYMACNTNFLLYIVGAGPMEETINEYIFEHKMEGRILLLGFKKEKELKELIYNSLCVCLPSEWYENGPYSVMEAMSQGKPVIVSDIGGLPELVEEGVNGFIAKSGDVNSLSAQMIKITKLADEQYEKMCKQAVQITQEKFDADNYAAMILKCYNNLLRDRD